MSYFPDREFKCPCCGVVKVSGFLVHLLNKVRESYGKAMIVNSGYRCKKHNRKVGGTQDSAHLKGLAADIKCENSTDRFLLLYFIFLAGFKRVGIYESFIHVDVSESLPQKVAW